MSVVTSEGSKNGTFSSPSYPSYYPAKTHCRYDFIGSAKERVQIIFTDFNLYHPDGVHAAGADRHNDRFKAQGQREKDEEKRKERERE